MIAVKRVQGNNYMAWTRGHWIQLYWSPPMVGEIVDSVAIGNWWQVHIVQGWCHPELKKDLVIEEAHRECQKWDYVLLSEVGCNHCQILEGGCQDMRFLSVQSLSMIGLGYKDVNEFWYQVYGILSKFLSDNVQGLKWLSKKESDKSRLNPCISGDSIVWWRKHGRLNKFHLKTCD